MLGVSGGISGYGLMLPLGFLLVMLGSHVSIMLEIFLCFSFSVLSAIEQSTADTVIDKGQGRMALDRPFWDDFLYGVF